MELWGREENGEKNLRGDCQCLCQSVFVTPCECIYVCIYYIYIELYVHTHLSIYTHTACFYLELMWSLGQMKCFRDPGESF